VSSRRSMRMAPARRRSRGEGHASAQERRRTAPRAARRGRATRPPAHRLQLGLELRASHGSPRELRTAARLPALSSAGRANPEHDALAPGTRAGSPRHAAPTASAPPGPGRAAPRRDGAPGRPGPKRDQDGAASGPSRSRCSSHAFRLTCSTLAARNVGPPARAPPWLSISEDADHGRPGSRHFLPGQSRLMRARSDRGFPRARIGPRNISPAAPGRPAKEQEGERQGQPGGSNASMPRWSNLRAHLSSRNAVSSWSLR
jgi:hypothetical protein